MVPAILITLLMLAFWLLSVRLKDVSIIDTAWGPGFVLIAWTEWSRQSLSLVSFHPTALLPVLVSVWGLRLSTHLFVRNHGKSEDFRYRQMREKWGNRFWWVSLFTVFGLQGLVMWIVSLPLHVGSNSLSSSMVEDRTSGGFSLLTIVGVTAWSIGILFEAVGDWQLAHFKSQPGNKGRVLQQGLWRYTRHPNYFGDSMVWWGFFLIGLSNHAAWWTVISPVLMMFLLMRVSGVSLLEQSLLQNRPGYRDYVRRTSAFFPWLPKMDLE